MITKYHYYAERIGYGLGLMTAGIGVIYLIRYLFWFFFIMS